MHVCQVEMPWICLAPTTPVVILLVRRRGSAGAAKHKAQGKRFYTLIMVTNMQSFVTG